MFFDNVKLLQVYKKAKLLRKYFLTKNEKILLEYYIRYQ